MSAVPTEVPLPTPTVAAYGLGLKHGHGQSETGSYQPLSEFRSNACRHELSKNLALFADPRLLEHKNVLHRDHFAFHTGHFGYCHHPAFSVALSADLNHHVDCRGDLPSSGRIWNVQVGHRHHSFEPPHRVTRSVSMDCRH